MGCKYGVALKGIVTTPGDLQATSQKTAAGMSHSPYGKGAMFACISKPTAIGLPNGGAKALTSGLILRGL
jgi:hypothetical protein